MIPYRSRTTTHGRNMAGARALWRATGMTDQDFDKPIIAVVNSFTQFVPGHVHLKDIGQLVAREIEAAGGVAKEFNTIAVDDRAKTKPIANAIVHGWPSNMATPITAKVVNPTCPPPRPSRRPRMFHKIRGSNSRPTKITSSQRQIRRNVGSILRQRATM